MIGGRSHAHAIGTVVSEGICHPHRTRCARRARRPGAVEIQELTGQGVVIEVTGHDALKRADCRQRARGRESDSYASAEVRCHTTDLPVSFTIVIPRNSSLSRSALEKPGSPPPTLAVSASFKAVGASGLWRRWSAPKHGDRACKCATDNEVEDTIILGVDPRDEQWTSEDREDISLQGRRDPANFRIKTIQNAGIAKRLERERPSSRHARGEDASLGRWPNTDEHAHLFGSRMPALAHGERGATQGAARGRTRSIHRNVRSAMGLWLGSLRIFDANDSRCWV